MLAMFMALIDDESDKDKFERLYYTYKKNDVFNCKFYSL